MLDHSAQQKLAHPKPLPAFSEQAINQILSHSLGSVSHSSACSSSSSSCSSSGPSSVGSGSAQPPRLSNMITIVTKPSPSPSPDNSSSSNSGESDSIPAPREWQSWLSAYRRGNFAPATQALDTVNEAAEGHDFAIFSQPSMADTVDRSSPADLVNFFKSKGYLPGPVGPYEEDRLRTMRRYGLDNFKRREAVDRICRLAKAYFKTPIVLISLMWDDRQVLAAESGWVATDPGLDEPLREIPLVPSLCTHALLRVRPEPDEAFVVPDTSKDWRFKGNPQALAQGGGLSFYAAANIHLPSLGPKDAPLTSDKELPPTLPIGSICLVDSKPRDEGGFSLEDRRVLIDLADMAAHEFQLGRESARRETEASQASFLSAFVSQALISNATDFTGAPSTYAQAQQDAPNAPTRPSPSPIATPANSSSGSDLSKLSASDIDSTESLPTVAPQFQLPTASLCGLTGASAAAIFDVRAFQCPPQPAAPRGAYGAPPDSPAVNRRAPHARTVVGEPTTETSGAFEEKAGKIYLAGGVGKVDWAQLVNKQQAQLGETVCDGLREFYDHSVVEFDNSSGVHSPWNDLLGNQTQAVSATPIFDVDGSPALIIVLTSDDPGFRFDAADRSFIEGVGAVAVGALVRQRALDADRAKLAFVSQISHELRTPIHGVVSQVELIREFSTPEQLVKLSPFLDVADVCLESLRDVLDDVLDLGKLANQSPAEAAAAQRRSLVKGDLLQLAEDVTKATWVRKRRTDLVSVDAQTGNASQAQGKVDVLLEVEDRPGGWTAWLDTGGMKRVLLNLLGNALKFTTKGHVKLSVREAAIADGKSRTSARRKVILEVEDTGKGMSEDFLRDGKLFTPFVQEDSFANGAGLGLSICLTIIHRMGGKLDVVSALGKGTTVRITLPLEFCALTPGVHYPAIHSYGGSGAVSSRKSSVSRSGVTYSVRTISDELGALFSPGTKLTTPFEEKAGFSFGAAVEAAQETLGRPTLGRIPSTKRKPSKLRPTPTSALAAASASLASPDAQRAELADEVAKLSVSAAVSSSAPSSVTSSPGDRPSADPTPTQEHHTAQKGQPQPTQSNGSFFAPFIPPTPKVGIAPLVKVLVADDNPLARNILTKLLSGKGVAFGQAADGQEAIDRFSEGNGSYNLLLIDVQMPKKDGIQASFEIRQVERENGWQKARIIALTGLSNEADMVKAGVMPGHSGPCDGWLVKGGKSLRTVIAEVMALQAVLEARAAGGDDSGESSPESSPALSSTSGADE